MKSLFLAALTAGALTVGFMPAQSFADPNIHLRVGVGMGDSEDDWHHRHHHRCHWVKVWHHHHPVMIKQCGWRMHGGMGY